MKRFTPKQIYDIFVSRKDCFTTQQISGAHLPTKRPITLDDIEKHLRGEITIGLYCLDTDNSIKWACVDIDIKRGVEINEAELRRVEKEANLIYDLFPDFPRMLEFSGKKGFHVWIFFKIPVSAEYGQRLVKSRLNRVGLNRHELFPKQVSLNEYRKYGNLCKLICGFHKVSKKWSKILKMEGVL